MLSRTNHENEVKKLEIQSDTVYIRSNIKEVVDCDGDLVWEYDEISMSLLDYIKQSFPSLQADTDNAIAELMIYIAEQQKQIDSAIAELSVLIGGIVNNV